MASKKSLNAGNLEALGAARWAALLIEISDGNATVKRPLRLELAGADALPSLPRRSGNAWRGSDGRARSSSGKT
jgi:hypothetical protein